MYFKSNLISPNLRRFLCEFAEVVWLQVPVEVETECPAEKESFAASLKLQIVFLLAFCKLFTMPKHA
jgi:hypothetical protein